MRINGLNDGDPWALEVETDRMAEGEPFTVSVWVGRGFLDDPAINLTEVQGAFLSAQDARDLAGALLMHAAAVDSNNARLAALRAEEETTR